LSPSSGPANLVSDDLVQLLGTHIPVDAICSRLGKIVPIPLSLGLLQMRDPKPKVATA